MSRELVQRNFRYANQQVARNQPITVVYRGTNSPAPLFAAHAGSQELSNPLTTDNQGSIEFYLESGFYDFLALGIRVMFDVDDDESGEGGDALVVTVAVPVATWTLTHPFGRLPIVALYDDEGRPQDNDYEATDLAVVVSWPYPVSGRAVLR